RVAAGLADLLHAGADQDSLLGDEHQLVVVADRLHADHVAVAVGRLDVDHALAAATDQAVVLDRRALAESIHATRQHHAVAEVLLMTDNDHGNDGIAVLQLDALHAARGAAHGAAVVFP